MQGFPLVENPRTFHWELQLRLGKTNALSTYSVAAETASGKCTHTCQHDYVSAFCVTLNAWPLPTCCSCRDVRHHPFHLNCQFRTKCWLSVHVSGQSFPLGPGFWNKLIFYDENLSALGYACLQEQEKERGTVWDDRTQCEVRLDTESMSSLDIYAVNTIIQLVKGSAKGILEKPLQISSKQKVFKYPENKTGE